MFSLSLFNFKDNEDIYIAALQAIKKINENFFKIFVHDKKVDSRGIMIFFNLFFLLFSN